MGYEWATALVKSLTLLAERAAGHLPGLLGALALALGGWLIARLLQAFAVRLLGRLRWFARSRAVQGTLRRVGIERPVPEVIAAIVFWVVLLFFLSAATETLGLPVLATWLSSLSHYLPRVLVGLLIVLAGVLAAGLARDAIATAAAGAGLAYGALVGRVAQLAILAVAVVTGVDQVGIDSKFLTVTVTIVLAAGIGGIGLAFGIGARTAVSNIIACHYLRQTYRVGHTVRVGEVQGTIIQITTTAVILESAAGQVLVPAKEFSETVSVLVTGGA